MQFSEVPPFIPDLVVGAPVDFVWEGAREHIGPTETVTPLFERLGGTTTCGQLAMCAGILLWGAWRFRGQTEVDHNFELAEAAFAYQVDYRYVDREAGPKGKAPDQPPALSAVMKLNSYMRQALDSDQYWMSYYIPISETFHSAHIIQHVLPATAKAAFTSWLDRLAGNVKKIAVKPDEPFRKKKEFASQDEYERFIAAHRGAPLPPDILMREIQEEERRALVSKFLAGLDWRNNRYLRTPDAMRKLGFSGEPYAA